MTIDQATVRKIASLARIAISDAEAAAMEGELNGILGWVEQLGEVDVTGVEPMTAVIPNTLRLRDDVIDADPLTGGGRRDDVRVFRRAQGDRMMLWPFSPFALSLSKGRSFLSRLSKEVRCFDKLSTNGF